MTSEFAPLADLVMKKEWLLEQLTLSRPATEVLRPVRAKMAENQTLLAAAIKGVAAAGERLEALQQVQNNLTVYDQSGRVDLVQKRQRSLEKKA